ncbi:hypothetical protein BDN72DRAFT_965574 [Pluteus cervinus]|uniref:Uncharacterized protein n=1 Tax=Pluteus cervinus TaxID=181527 RepID=A0ACD3A4R7_9AGAR|nr:hypothetical protein BDN72DRAFT_965574 [Pluteus cervinus]
MHRILQNPELLHMIFSDMKKEENLCNAVVCKKWSEVALDVLWADVTNIYPLVRLLAPITILCNRRRESYCFSRSPTPRDWERFLRYSRRVRKLEYDQKALDLHSTLFDHIARTRPTSVLFPNLISLDWCAAPSRLVLFLHPGLRHLVLRVVLDAHETLLLGKVARRIVALSNNISTLEITQTGSSPCSTLGSGIPILEFEADLCCLIRGLGCLQQLYLPRGWLTTRVAEAASKLSSLHTIDAASAKSGEGCFLDTMIFSPSLRLPLNPNASQEQTSEPEEATSHFAALADLRLATRFTNAVVFLQSSGWNAKNLTTLHIWSQILESAHSFGEIIDTISRICPGLVSLSLKSRTAYDPEHFTTFYYPRIGDINHSRGEGVEIRSQTDQRVTSDHIYPLLKLKLLKKLELHHHLPVALSPGELEAFAIGIGQNGCLEELDLFSEHPWTNKCERSELIKEKRALEEGSDKLVLKLRHTLHTFAKWCPTLRNLSLFVRPDPIQDLKPPHVFRSSSPDDGHTIHSPFPNLETLYFGYSPLSRQATPFVVAFLSHYISSKVVICGSGRPWHERHRRLSLRALRLSIKNWKRTMKNCIRDIMKGPTGTETSPAVAHPGDIPDQELDWFTSYLPSEYSPETTNDPDDPMVAKPDSVDVLERDWSTWGGEFDSTTPNESDDEDLKELLDLFSNRQDSFIAPHSLPNARLYEYVNKHPRLKSFLQDHIPGEVRFVIGEEADEIYNTHHEYALMVPLGMKIVAAMRSQDTAEQRE